ncbi:MAG TPA: GspE/PulE family protein [Candidatus Andersenbacteria bacterium]|nr:GspE/PulE family protein [Candidatus Andersenbacteria bacterium]
MPDKVSESILEVLVESRDLSTEDGVHIREQMDAKEGTAFELLVGKRKVTEEQFTKAYAAVLHMPYVNLSEHSIDKKTLDIIPESTAREHLVIAYEQDKESLKLAIADPADRQIVEFIHKKVDKKIEVSLASSTTIREALVKYQGTLAADLQQVIDEAKNVRAEGSDLSKVAEDLPIIKIADSILRHAIMKDASDIHIEPTEDTVVVRYRVDGILHDMMVLPKTVLAGVVARIKILSNLKIDEHRLPQDGRFKIENEDYNVAFRVSTLPVFDGEKIVMRLLDESGKGITVDEIKLSKRNRAMFKDNIEKPNGMVLVTGPTGSGKTTTLYAVMRQLNTADVNISTIEDPVEYRMQRINQTQVSPKIGLTFSNGLRALVRQDPDIIMVGEIRDEETASLAVNAALTGHLVLSTLHTNSAAGAIPRLMDMKIEPFLIASTANIIIGQRLVRTLCTQCRKQTVMDKTMLDSLAEIVDLDRMLMLLKEEGIVDAAEKTWERVPMFTAEGCDKCNEGYKGRLGIYEMLEMTPSLQKLVTANVTSDVIETAAKEEQKMVTMVEDGIMKVVQGITSVAEVLRVAKE